jgi:2-amino-4-hydroxy-6-hydroxymethyldihydropteridine diphosphokinase
MRLKSIKRRKCLTVEALIALGSNVGDRHAHMRFALRALAQLPQTTLLRASRLHRTAPMGGPQGQGAFLNAAALLRTELSPMGLFVHLKRLETLRGRRPGPRWGPRTLDLDILYFGSVHFANRWLEIPHPRAAGREFVLIPAEEIANRTLLKRRLRRPAKC